MFTSKTLTAYEILQCLYVDDGAFPFGSREDLKRGMELILHRFGRFSLEMHIGRGASPSKTECVFVPSPQFFQHAQCRNTAATLIQRAFRRAHTSTHPHQLIEQPAPSLTSPADFPIGCRVVVASSHPTQAGKGGTVCKLTKKCVMFSSNDSPTDIICILPKSLATYHPDERRKINSADDNNEHDPGQTEREHATYDQLNETQDFPVADCFVSFTRTF